MGEAPPTSPKRNPPKGARCRTGSPPPKRRRQRGFDVAAWPTYDVNVKIGLLVSFVAGLVPTAIVTAVGIVQHEDTSLPGILTKYHVGYLLLLLFASIVLYVLRKRNVALGLLLSVAVGALVLIGMGY